MNIFSMDESGYTGHNLLDKLQPWQGASSINISHDDAAELIRQHFPKRQSDELKFSVLQKRDNYRKILYELHKDLLDNYPCITCVADKRFVLMLMFVEYAVEPFYSDMGLNLYEDGGNSMMASMTYYLGPAYYGSDFDVILRAFQVAMREKNQVSVEALISAVRAVDWHQLQEVLGPMALAHPDCIDAILNSDTTTDASLMILISLITRTEVLSPGPYAIEHDRSKNLLNYNESISSLINITLDAKFRQSDLASIHFPLKLENVYQIDSKLSPSVQLCDVLIGAAIRAAGELKNDSNHSFYSPMKLYNDDQIIHFLPDIDFANQKNFRKGSQGAELIEFIEKEFSADKRNR